MCVCFNSPISKSSMHSNMYAGRNFSSGERFFFNSYIKWCGTLIIYARIFLFIQTADNLQAPPLISVTIYIRAMGFNNVVWKTHETTELILLNYKSVAHVHTRLWYDIEGCHQLNVCYECKIFQFLFKLSSFYQSEKVYRNTEFVTFITFI